MNFHNLQSLIGSRKRTFTMKEETVSFAVAPDRQAAYIEPSFTKNEFETERPQVLLVSAVGATGKSTLAQILSSRLQLPLLSLASHKPVGDNTITGLLTTSFAVETLSDIFQCVRSGEFGIIIDGIDEGRSKTTEQAFHAFLDNVASLSGDAASPSFVLLGRTQILEECWLYLDNKGISTGLLTIDPFSLEQARSYIDSFTDGLASAHAIQYQETRNLILTKLSAAFNADDATTEGTFLSFIGYPPVLDAIVTLFEKEKNYHRLKEQLGHSASNEIEIDLLLKIADYILARERDDKVFPNIVQDLLRMLPKGSEVNSERIFDREEQCVRLISHILGATVPCSHIPGPVLNARYEEQLAPFIVEHPFVNSREFRNAIFEAVTLSILIASNNPNYHDLAIRYVDKHKDNYYLVYLLDLLAHNRQIPVRCLRVLLGAALEFRATNASVDVTVLGPDIEEMVVNTLLDIEIELAVGANSVGSKTFSFYCNFSLGETINLGSRLSSAYISLPGSVSLGGTRETELIAPIEISVQSLGIRSESLVLRPQSSANPDTQIFLQAEKVQSDVINLTMPGVDFTIAVEDADGLTYPLVQHIQKKEIIPQDLAIKEKYLRLRKILTHFRSHSRGSMAKYRNKIENPRIAGNPIGRAVLTRLVQDGVLVLNDPIYFLQPSRVDELLGISWPDLRRGVTSERLQQYLRSIAI